MKFKIGDKVKIVNVEGIYFGNKHFANGDITSVVKVCKTGEPYLDNNSHEGFIITDDEFDCIELLTNGDDK